MLALLVRSNLPIHHLSVRAFWKAAVDARGFGMRAGSTADAFTLFERLEARIEEHPGDAYRLASILNLADSLVLAYMIRVRLCDARPANSRMRGASQGMENGQIPSPTRGDRSRAEAFNCLLARKVCMCNVSI